MTKAAELAKMGEVLTNSQIGGRRNIVINGAMQVFQRGTSHTSITTSGYRADRFRSAISSLGTWTITQDSDAPSGFSNSLKYDCTTADASPAASNNLFIQHKIEGQNVQHLKKGTSDAEKVTIQFYVKCNKTGNVQFNIRDRDNTRQISSIITINSANTWEKKVFTIVGDTTGTLDNNNESSFELEWWLDAGSNYTTGTAPTAWEAVADTDRAAGTTIALGDSTDNYFQLTGVQMEVGEQATPFESRSYGEELALCQRYFQIVTASGRWRSTASNSIDSHSVNFNEMRSAPSATKSGGSVSNIGAEATNNITTNGFRYELTATSTGDAYYITRTITLDSEL